MIHRKTTLYSSYFRWFTTAVNELVLVPQIYGFDVTGGGVSPCFITVDGSWQREIADATSSHEMCSRKSELNQSTIVFEFTNFNSQILLANERGVTISMLYSVMLDRNLPPPCGHLSLGFYMKKRLRIACITSEELRQLNLL